VLLLQLNEIIEKRISVRTGGECGDKLKIKKNTVINEARNTRANAVRWIPKPDHIPAGPNQIKLN
jgi:hypothetical protein